MELTIEKQPNISLNQIMEHKEQGFSVVRSAHIGNHRMYNLVLAEAGVDMLLVDHNQTIKDTNYQPESIIANRQKSTELSSQANRLCLRVQSENTAYQKGEYLDTIHFSGLQQAFPNTNIRTNTEYLRSNEKIVSEIVTICRQKMPELFQRVVQPDGLVQRSSTAVNRTSMLEVIQLTDNPRAEQEALMMPNELDIICGFIIETLTTERNIQYHISGPDMVNYINGILPTLQKIYSLISSTSSFGEKLPNKLTVKLVPGTPLGIACLEADKEKFDSISEPLSELIKFEDSSSLERARIYQDSSIAQDAKRDLSDKIKQQKRELREEVHIGAGENGHILDQNSTTYYITQYDVTSDNKLHIPKFVRTLPISRLLKIMKLIEEKP